jgi:flagellar protein FlgJ
MQSTDRIGSAPPAVMPVALDRPANPKNSPKEVGKAFEGLFASILIKQMRQSLNGQGLFGHDPSDVFGGLFDHFMSQHISQNGGLGIAAMMQKRLEQRSGKT